MQDNSHSPSARSGYSPETIQSELEQLAFYKRMLTSDDGKSSLMGWPKPRATPCQRCWYCKVDGQWICSDDKHSHILFPRLKK